MAQYKTFKQLVSLMSEIRTQDDLNRFCHEIDMSYQHDKISFKDNETFYAIVNNVIRRDLPA